MKKLWLCLVSVLLAAALTFSPASAAEVPLPFRDVKSGDWFYEAVSYTYRQDLFHGVSANRFDPHGAVTRAMVVKVLANLSGVDEAYSTERHFTDVAPGQWYYASVEWAARYAIVSGVGKFRFQPGAPATREQIAAILYRYARCTGNDTSLGTATPSFRDYSQVSDYAKTAVDWAVHHGILRGESPSVLNPRGTATRAQLAQIFYSAGNVLRNKTIQTEPVPLPQPSKIDVLLSGMTLEEKVGQLFLPRYPGGNAAALTKRYHPAGYTLYAKDFQGKTKAEVQAMTGGLQKASKTPLLIAADEEGGSVVRISSNPKLASTPFASPREIYQKSGVEGIRADTEAKARLLLELGVNLNLAPVCDVSTDPGDYIYNRTLGVPAGEAARVIGAMVETMEQENFSGALKHFPGYGNNLDTHTGISIDNRPYEQFQKEDFLPFEAGIKAGAPSVLVSHNIVTAMDPKKPASLSQAVHEVLRNELHFQGVIMTDDLSMDAIGLYTGGESPAVAAFLAGNDLLLTSDWAEGYQALLSAAKNGIVPQKRIEESVRRVLEWKEQKGLL